MKDSEIILEKEIMIVSETDKKGNIIFANKDFCKISGYSIEELIDKEHNIVRHPDMPDAAFKDLWETVSSGNIWKGIVKNRTKNNQYYWVNATVFPSKTPSGLQRYISIRVKPTKQEVDDAKKLYTSLL